MQIQTIGLLFLIAVAIRLLSGKPVRLWLISAASAITIYVMQPEIPIRYMSFWLPALTIFVILINWVLTTPAEERRWKENLPMLLFLAGILLLVSAARYLEIGQMILVSRPPKLEQVLVALAVAGLLIALISRFPKTSVGLCYASIFMLIGLFVVLKVPAFSYQASKFLRLSMGQTTDLASAVDIRWLGFSYLAFRMIHTLRDRTKGRLGYVTLQEYFIYVVFFPAVTAGPIDRLDRFVKDLRCPLELNTFWENVIEGSRRLLIGVFKKFVIADTLALVSISASNVDQVTSGGWLWLLLYAYSFQILFDFSGYTDIAIGLGRILGIRLPENFQTPYLKPSLTQFWNSWHITLTQWIRAYYFNPLTRWFRSSKLRLSVILISLITQVTTMVLIGLWHGVTLNFLIWGLWHGLGLFLENRWNVFSRPWLARLEGNRPLQAAVMGLSVFLTFNYVTLGWLWFALPETDQAAKAMLRLFGFA